MSGDRPVLFNMKELWGFLIHAGPEEEKLMKKIRKAQHLAEYEGVVSELFCRMRAVSYTHLDVYKRQRCV